MGEIETEVDSGLSDLGLEITGLCKDAGYKRDQVILDLCWLDISEVNRESFLDEVKKYEIVLENRVLESLLSKVEECPETDFRRVVVTIDLTVHGISAGRIDIVELLFDLLDGSLT